MAPKRPFEAITEAVDRLFGRGDAEQQAAYERVSRHAGAAVAAVALGRLTDTLPALRDDLNTTRRQASEQADTMIERYQSPEAQALIGDDPDLKAHAEQAIQSAQIRQQNLAAAGHARAAALTAASSAAVKLLQLAGGGEP